MGRKWKTWSVFAVLFLLKTTYAEPTLLIMSHAPALGGCQLNLSDLNQQPGSSESKQLFLLLEEGFEKCLPTATSQTVGLFEIAVP